MTATTLRRLARQGRDLGVEPRPIPKFASRRATESLLEYAMRISAERKYVKNFCLGRVMLELSPEREQELLRLWSAHGVLAVPVFGTFAIA